MALVPQARIGDVSTGHWIGPLYFPPTPLIEGSPDTFSCCINSSRVGDKAAVHIGFLFGIIPIPGSAHQPIASTGDPVVLINFRPAFRVGDSYSCGDIQAVGCVTNLKCNG